MVLDRDLVKEFASVMAPASKEKSDGKVYGTISKIQNGVTYVTLDGSGHETPVDDSVVCAVNDRVLVQIRDHKAYVSDNFTAPPNGRATDKFYYFDNNRGMIIGRLNPTTHEPEGNYVLITDTDYRICNEDDEVLAVFGDTQSVIGLATEKHIRMTPLGGYEIYDGNDLLAVFDGSQVRLGDNSSNARIYFCDSKGVIYYTNNALVLRGDETTGLSSVRSDDKAAQVAVTASSNRLSAAMSLLKSDGTVGSQVALEYDAATDKYNVAVQGASVAVNGHNVLTDNDKLMLFGTVQAKGNVNYHKSRTFTFDLGPSGLNYLPSGYALAGLRQVSTNHPTAIKITQFRTLQSTNEISATLYNDSTIANRNYTVTITLKWFAIKSGSAGSGSSTPEPIILPDEPGDDEPN